MPLTRTAQNSGHFPPGTISIPPRLSGRTAPSISRLKSCNLYAVNPNGEENWAFITGNNIWFSSPAIGANGTIYIGSWDRNLYAINPDGTQQWAFPTGARIDSSPTIGPNGAIYVGSDDGNLYAIGGSPYPVNNPTGQLSCTDSFSLSGLPGQDATGKVTVCWQSTNAATDGACVVSQLNDGAGHTIPPSALQPHFPQTLLANNSYDCSLTVHIPSNCVAGTYTGTLTCSASVGPVAPSL